MAFVYLISGDVHTGKTTRLRKWLEKIRAEGKQAAGILAGPDIDGLRHLTSVETGEMQRLQVWTALCLLKCMMFTCFQAARS